MALARTRSEISTHRSHPIRAQASGGPIQISEQALISYLRAAIDATVPGTALAHISLQVTGRDELSGVIIQLIAQYGTPLLPQERSPPPPSRRAPVPR